MDSNKTQKQQRGKTKEETEAKKEAWITPELVILNSKNDTAMDTMTKPHTDGSYYTS